MRPFGTVSRSSRPGTRTKCVGTGLLAASCLALLLACGSESENGAATASVASEPRSGLVPLTASSEAIEPYLQGRRYLDSLQLEPAREAFDRALELDPDFVLALTGKAWSEPRFRDMFEILERARALAETAPISEGERLSVIAQHASAWLERLERSGDGAPETAQAATSSAGPDLVDRYLEAVVAAMRADSRPEDVDRVVALVAPDVRYEHPRFGMVVEGRDALRDGMLSFLDDYAGSKGRPA